MQRPEPTDIIEEMYSVYDAKAGNYLPCMTFKNDAVAIRSFTAAVAQEDHQFHQHAEDFSLWHIASWNYTKGNVEPLPAGKIVLVLAHEILAQQQAPTLFDAATKTSASIKSINDQIAVQEAK